jgi:hypothetical protein
MNLLRPAARCVCPRLDLIVLQAADRSIDFQHRQHDLIHAADSVSAECAVQLVPADVLVQHVRFDDLAIAHQQPRLPLDQLAETAIQPGNVGFQVIQQQRAGRDRAGGRDVSGPVIAFCAELKSRSSRMRSNGVICPTSRLPLKRTPISTRSQMEPARSRISRCTGAPGKERSSQFPVPVVLLAVTGTGALFGVLRYPVALFFSTVQITTSNSRWSRPE